MTDFRLPSKLLTGTQSRDTLSAPPTKSTIHTEPLMFEQLRQAAEVFVDTYVKLNHMPILETYVVDREAKHEVDRLVEKLREALGKGR